MRHKVAQQAIASFGEPYPREQDERVFLLSKVSGETREEYDPFYKLDDVFYDSVQIMEDYFERKATKYAKRLLSKNEG